MTNLDKEYPAHKALFRYIEEIIPERDHLATNPVLWFGANYGSIHDIKKEFDQLQAENKRLKDAVVILPDDAEPEMGDLCFPKILCFPHGSGVIAYPAGLLGDNAGKIIQRNGKPVIRESELGENPNEQFVSGRSTQACKENPIRDITANNT